MLSEVAIKPSIRHGEKGLPAPWRTCEPWPLTDQTVIGGSFHEFRYRVWRSLLAYNEQDDLFRTRFRYDYMDASRITEIQFHRDEEYLSYRDLSKLDLLIVVRGVADVPNPYLMPLLDAVLKLRAWQGKPTWLYAPSKDWLRNTYRAPDALPQMPGDTPRREESTLAARRRAATRGQKKSHRD